MIRTTLALFILSVALGVSEGIAQPPREGKRAGERWADGGRSMMERLNLTDEQRDKMEKMRLDHQRKMLQTRNRIAEIRLDIRALYNAEKPDRGAIEKALKSITDLQHQQKMEKLDHWFAVNGILTADQQKVWKDHPGRWGARERREGFGRGGRGRPMR